ncbi:oligoendopeptidase F family protein [Sporosarcina sp. ANT_H38]|uniref:M3 family metallopeptidase n=1 Tax=unclassified Sporosarcina TaxID=2647733 RepID=UPI0011F18D00|nr:MULTISPECIES: M3 family metallopeptidase [unclassified Sporosarcina]KAA0940630.1 oligoendopeptidase F family protein [Sporosarcina sp. ANT_H38]QJS06566.1 oligopeptidase PepB [Sporosarcina sp.]
MKVREEISDSFKLNISLIFKCVEDWEKEYKSIQDLLIEYRSIGKDESISSSSLLRLIKFKELIEKRFEKLYGYSLILLDIEKTNKKALLLMEKSEQLYEEVLDSLVNIEKALSTISLEEFSNLSKGLPELELYENYFLNLASNKDLLESYNGILLDAFQAPEKNYTLLNNDFTFKDIKDSEGNIISVGLDNYFNYLMNNDRGVRKASFDSLMETYIQYGNTITNLLMSDIKNKHYLANKHNKNSYLELVLEQDGINLEIFNNLISNIRNNVSSLHEFMKYKKTELGVNNIGWFDMFFSTSQKTDVNYSFKEACDIARESFKYFGKSYQIIFDMILEEKWIDVLPNRGKERGAYTFNIYERNPFVLMNFTGQTDDVFNLVHEVGHAIQHFYTNKKQPYTYSQFSDILGEFFALLNENLLFEYLDNMATTKTEEKYFLNNWLERFRGFVFRQSMYSDFEVKLHSIIENGEVMIPEDISEIYMHLLSEYYGTSLKVDKNLKYEWLKNPNFFDSFYSYRYVMGFLLSVTVAQKIIDGKIPVENILKGMEAGSSQSFTSVMKILEIDLFSSQYILDAIEIFNRKFKRLNELCK